MFSLWDLETEHAHAEYIDTSMSHQKQTRHPSTKVAWRFEELFDNNASDNGLSLSASVAVNKQILEVILTPDKDVPTNLMHVIIILMYMMAHSTVSIRACAL